MNYITPEQAATLVAKYALPQGLGMPYWPVIFKDVIKLYLESQPAKPVERTDEQDSALCEAYCNESSDQYFKARTHLDSAINRRIYYAGHRKAWLTAQELT